MTLTKYAYTNITTPEVRVILEGFELFKPKYKSHEDIDINVLMKKHGKNYIKIYKKEHEKPTIEAYNRLKSFFEDYRNVTSSMTYAPYNSNDLRIKLSEKEPDIIIDVLRKLLETKENWSELYSKKYDRHRKDEQFYIQIFKEDATGLIEGMKALQIALSSHWVNEVQHLP